MSATEAPATEQRETALLPREMVTPRAILVGMACSFILGVADPYANLIIKGSYLGSNFTPIGVVFLFAILVGIVNTVLRSMNPQIALTPGELAVVYIMSLVASAIPSYGLTEVLLPAMASMYYATPENKWFEDIVPRIQPYLMPQDPEAVRSFFEGLPQGEVIPWGVWTTPLTVWLSFVLVLYFVMFCVTVILRKQWIERERLVFPLVKLPTEMIDPGDDARSPVTPFFRNRLMWIGFAIPFLINGWNSIHNYIYFFPTIYFTESIGLFNNRLVLPLNLSFPLVGFGYLLSLEVSFSLWLFFLISRTQGLMNATFGIDIAGNTALPATYQGFGALFTLVFFGLWMARSHLKDVVRKAFKGDPSIDDSGESLSYRAAVVGGGLGVVFLIGWMMVIGLSLWVAAVVFLLVFVVYVGFSRIVAEGGVLFAETLNPQEFMISGFTGPVLGAQNLVGLGLTKFWMTHTRTLIMPSMANGLKLADAAGILNPRLLTVAVGLAILTSMAASIYTVMFLAYQYGGINLNWHFFGELQQSRFGYYAANIASTSDPFGRWFFFGIGAAVMWALMMVRQQLIWWPLHFIGFPVGASAPLAAGWFSIFIAWMLKGLILKYGGINVYRTMLPLFLGLILGEFTSAGLWVIIDALTGITGHVIFN